MSSYRQDTVQQVDQRIKETTQIMRHNIDICIERGEKLEDLEEKSIELDNGAMRFKKVSRTLRQKLCMDNAKKTCCIVSAIITIILIVSFGVCNAMGKC